MATTVLNPPNTTQLPCDCVVESITGQLAQCPAGHDTDMPDRTWLRKDQK
jgi:hypothetical protein